MISLLSRQFAYGTNASAHPVLLFLFLMTVAFIASLRGLWTALRCRNHRAVRRCVVFVAVTSRLLLLPSSPIKEVDIYRYMWDGIVVAAAENPYRFSPEDVLSHQQTGEPTAISQLADVRDASRSHQVILSRVHFAHLTTIYPPVSQIVFAVVAGSLPDSTSVFTRLVATKSAIVLFDILTLCAVLRLLQLFRKPVGWAICYGWSPLVLKEFANSGHLDAIAVCLCIWALTFWLQGIQRLRVEYVILAAALLGLSIGAKLYAVVLVPVIATGTWRFFRFPTFLTSGATLVFVSVACLWPMMASTVRFDRSQPSGISPGIDEVSRGQVLQAGDPPLPEDFDAVMRSSNRSGLDVASQETRPLLTNSMPLPKGADGGFQTFMTSWKINDLIFLVVEENLRPASEAWFSIVPDQWKRRCVAVFRTDRDVSDSTTAFRLARIITTCVFLVIAGLLAVRAWRVPIHRMPESCFLMLATFWLLLPTQNPWYWIWAMPLLPFARHRSWLLMSGCVTIYYLRFWFIQTWSDQPVLWTEYDGRKFFSFVVVWFEYVPFFAVLFLEWRSRRKISGH